MYTKLGFGAQSTMTFACIQFAGKGTPPTESRKQMKNNKGKGRLTAKDTFSDDDGGGAGGENPEQTYPTGT